MLFTIAFLVVVTLGSPYLGSAQNQQGSQNQPENNCNTCCQGPSGIPGIPGPAGHNGLAGRDGQTGLKGSKGDLGISIKGDKGDIGLPGAKGTSPQPGKSAFTAVKTNVQTGSTNEVVTFQHTTANVNDHFSLANSKFTCVFPGTYVFMYSIGIYTPNDIHVQLVKNGVHIVTAHTRTGGFNQDYDTTSSSAVLNLEAGDEIWLRFGSDGGRLYSNTCNCNVFTGFLLYEN